MAKMNCPHIISDLQYFWRACSNCFTAEGSLLWKLLAPGFLKRSFYYGVLQWHLPLKSAGKLYNIDHTVLGKTSWTSCMIDKQMVHQKHTHQCTVHERWAENTQYTVNETRRILRYVYILSSTWLLCLLRCKQYTSCVYSSLLQVWKNVCQSLNVRFCNLLQDWTINRQQTKIATV